ncbi:MAG TPA: DUF11 domain-containing protein [Kouleothrix sp.]|uniref:DUF11 domain-containing protein n=1 Tax=Kouleothrix sp. TaxID=2779161 RepID=UPI002CA7A562|nr:DUF11 domain-containing protein [Kouleothrix sp.]HRC76272.1 DUF11 domain-containing protein [Kouleothrix sp.]
MIFQKTPKNATTLRRRARLAWALAFAMPLALVVALAFPFARAAEIPPAGAAAYVVESFGPTFPITQGAWYSNPANGVGSGYYYSQFAIPCGWPADKPVMLDLYSPEFSKQGAADELRNDPAQSTVFELYGPNVTVGPGVGDPAPGAAGSIIQRIYAPTNVQTSWKRFYTFTAPVQCGVYVLRSEAGGDNGNVWRMRVGYDNDNNPNNRTPANYDDPDGQPGTGDEIIAGVIQTAFKHPQNPSTCLTLYEYVAPNQSQVSFHNFDMEASGSVTYYNPGGVAFPGTASGPGVWNRGTRTSRGTGDTIANPESGWWKIVSCAGNDRHFIQEGQQNVPAYFQQPPTPRAVVSKDDGLVDVHPNEVLNYTIQFTNTASMAPFPLAVPGAALQMVITDTLPAYTSFLSCAIDAPFTGSCAQNGGAVVYTLSGKLTTGSHGSVRLSIQTTPDAPVGPVRNDVALLYRDSIGNPYLATGNDIDAIAAADLSLTKSVDQPRPNVGDTVTFDIVVLNSGPANATDLVVSDPLPAGLEFVAATPSAGSYDDASGDWSVGTLPVNTSARLRLSARVTGHTPMINTAQVASVDQPDPDSAPGNNNPAEDDQASAAVTPQVADLSLTKAASNTSATNGDAMFYTVSVTNSGPDAATGVAVSDPLPSGVQYSSAEPSQGSYNPANGSWLIGNLAVDQTVRLKLYVLVITDQKVTNTAQVSAAAQFDPDSTPGNNNPAEDDQASVTTPVAPTAVVLSSFTATRKPGGVLLAWVTSSEVNSWGFDLYRSADGVRAHATRVTTETIVAQGRGQGGASYSWLDTTAAPDAAATYWLVETESGGDTHDYGPVTLSPLGMANDQQVFIPVAAN